MSDSLAVAYLDKKLLLSQNCNNILGNFLNGVDIRIWTLFGNGNKA